MNYYVIISPYEIAQWILFLPILEVNLLNMSMGVLKLYTQSPVNIFFLETNGVG